MFYQTNHMQTAKRAGKCCFCPWRPWPWPSNSSKRRTKHICVNLAQIHSAVPGIFHTQTKTRLTVPKQNLPQFTACRNTNYS